MTPKDRPKLSVVIPVFNAGTTIRSAINSVLDENVNAEIVVQDGGSKDETLDILATFGDKVSVVSEPDNGQSQAINRAIRRATGDYIGWLNADDIYMPGGLNAIHQTAREQQNAEVIYGDYALVRVNGEIFRRYYVQAWDWKRFISHGCYVWSGASFFRRDIFDRFGYIDESLHYCMDLEFFLRIGAGVRAIHTPALVGAYRVNEAAKSSSAPWGFVKEGHQVLSKYSRGSLENQVRMMRAESGKVLYLATRRFWLSDTWSKIRPEKKR